jgi:mono/diheme cytochrome c family protein
MDLRVQFGLIAFLATAGAAPLAAQVPSDASAQPKQAAPDSGATPATSGAPSSTLIARGDTVFHGPGNCYACHGTNGTGTVGPNLTDAEWIHSKGTYEEIVAQILKGVPKEEAKSGIPMPPKGGSSISDDDVKAVAAYVYSLRQK